MSMPIISKFYGISIYMYFIAKEHEPSHIHASYQDYNAVIKISDGSIIKGDMPKSKLKLIKEWVLIHKEELIKMWNTQEIKKIDALTKRRK